MVNFRIKFDEALTLGGAGPVDSVGQRVEKPPAGNGPNTPDPLILSATSTDLDNGDNQAQFSQLAQRIPKSCSVEKPGYRTASKFTASFDFKDLPIDPRTVRAAAVEIHMGTVSDADFADGFRGNTGGRRLPSVLRPTDDNLVVVCVVDEWNVTHDESGSHVSLTGRDLRGILIDTPLNAGLKGAGTQFLDGVDLSQDIQNVVKQILTWNPYFEQVQVVCNPEDWPDAKIPSPGDENGVPRHQKGARGKQKSGKATTNTETTGDALNFWDIIVQSCYIVGAIPYFQGNRLCIRPAATVFDKLRGPIDPVRNPTPFKDGQTRGFDELSQTTLQPALRTRKLVYGRDTKSMTFNRKYGGWRKPKVVRAVCKFPGAETLVGIWPPEFDDRTAENEAKRKNKANKRSPGAEKASAEVLTIPVYRVASLEQLTTIARAAYEEVGRGEMGGQVTTKNLASFGGGNADPDLLTLEPGDGVEMLVDTRAVNVGAPLVSSYTDYNRESFEKTVADIAAKLGDENLARVIVATARGQVSELQRFFRVHNVTLDFNRDSGISIAFDYENYVVVRDQAKDASAAAGVAIAVATPATQPGNPSPTSKPPGSSIRSL